MLKAEQLFIGMKEEEMGLCIMVSGGPRGPEHQPTAISLRMNRAFWRNMMEVFETANLVPDLPGEYRIQLRRAVNLIKQGLKDWKDKLG